MVFINVFGFLRNQIRFFPTVSNSFFSVVFTIVLYGKFFPFLFKFHFCCDKMS